MTVNRRSPRPSLRWPVTLVAVAAMTAAFVSAAPVARAAETGHIYWVEDDTDSLGRADLDGGNVVNPFIGIYSNPGRIAVDADHIYWASPDTDEIERADLDGTHVEDFVGTGTGSYPEGLAVYDGHLYWGGEQTRTIGRADLDGTGVETSFISLSAGSSRGLSAGPAGIYWTEPGRDTIGHADLDGTDVDESLVDTGGNPQEVVADSGHIYWTNAADDTIGRASLTGGAVDNGFLTGLSSPRGLAIDSGHLYWANLEDRSIGRANLDGTGVDNGFVSTGPGPSGVAIGPAPADTTAPSTTIALTPATPNGSAGWYRTAVGVTVTASDEGSGVAQTRCALDPASVPGTFADLPAGACALSTVAADGTHTVWAASVDQAGNAGAPVSATVKVDATAPTLTWSTHPASYTIDQSVTITCTAADPAPGSGLASSSCASNGLSGVAAYTLGVGTHTLTASAADVAGNTRSAQTGYAVTITPAGLCTVTGRLVQGSAKYAALKTAQKAVVDASWKVACSIVAAITPTLPAKLKPGLVSAFRAAIDGLARQGWLTSAQAATLDSLAGSL